MGVKATATSVHTSLEPRLHSPHVTRCNYNFFRNWSLQEWKTTSLKWYPEQRVGRKAVQRINLFRQWKLIVPMCSSSDIFTSSFFFLPVLPSSPSSFSPNVLCSILQHPTGKRSIKESVKIPFKFFIGQSKSQCSWSPKWPAFQILGFRVDNASRLAQLTNPALKEEFLGVTLGGCPLQLRKNWKAAVTKHAFYLQPTRVDQYLRMLSLLVLHGSLKKNKKNSLLTNSY